jgi:hypothetical protein
MPQAIIRRGSYLEGLKFLQGRITRQFEYGVGKKEDRHYLSLGRLFTLCTAYNARHTAPAILLP